MVVVGSFVWLGVVRLGGVVFRCPTGGSCGRHPWCRLAGGGLSASAFWVGGFAVVWLSLPLSSVPPGWRLCVRGVGRAAWPLPIRRWVAFPSFPVVLFFFFGGVGLLRRRSGGKADTALGRLGSGVERPVGGVAIPGGGGARVRGVAGQQGRVVGSGGGCGGSVGGGGGGGGGVGLGWVGLSRLEKCDGPV